MAAERPGALDAFGAIFAMLGGLGIIAIGLALFHVLLQGALLQLSNARWLLVLGGLVVSIYQLFVGLSLESPRPATRHFAFHYSLYACLILAFVITWNFLLNLLQGFLVSMIATPYAVFYGIAAWYFWQPHVRDYFDLLAERQEWQTL